MTIPCPPCCGQEHHALKLAHWKEGLLRWEGPEDKLSCWAVTRAQTLCPFSGWREHPSFTGPYASRLSHTYQGECNLPSQCLWMLSSGDCRSPRCPGGLNNTSKRNFSNSPKSVFTIKWCSINCCQQQLQLCQDVWGDGSRMRARPAACCFQPGAISGYWCVHQLGAF